MDVPPALAPLILIAPVVPQTLTQSTPTMFQLLKNVFTLVLMAILSLEPETTVIFAILLALHVKLHQETVPVAPVIFILT